MFQSTEQNAVYIVNGIYLAEAVLLQIGSVYLIGKLQVPTVATGIMVFLIAFMMEFLEFLQPVDMIRWIPFWNTTLGRGLVLIFLSAVIGMGNSFISLLAFIGAFVTLVWRVLGGYPGPPPPILGIDEPSISVEERERLREERKEPHDKPRGVK